MVILETTSIKYRATMSDNAVCYLVKATCETGLGNINLIVRTMENSQEINI
jgi:hypothetical protein